MKLINQIKVFQLIIWFSFLFFQLKSQDSISYFQQEVNYNIDVQLNDVAHTLRAFEKIQYINNSHISLNFIYFHLWPNAYKNNQTALAKQLLKQRNTTLYYSKPEERGYIDSLNFNINGKPVKWEYDKDHIDICKLYLNEPLNYKDTIIITTPFFVKIPDAKFSRLGHTNQAYFITQWYPKPAVFDSEGWHAMPYLDQGEFYSEFGSFDVKITLPKNYVLASTGDRIDEDEEDEFLNNKVIETINHLENNTRKRDGMQFPTSSSQTKTIQFRQYRVHDFAWFADKRFYVLHDQIQLPNTKRIVDTWAYFTDKNFDLWKESITYLNESTLFYSYLNGDYPYNHVSAVDGTIMAGGGMEYPNITVIGDLNNAFDLDVTIAHEVGHNWYYGILGSNERKYPAMDEGLNSFYELRYIKAKYPYKKLSDYLGRDSTFKLFGLNTIPYWKDKETAYFISAKERSDQPIITASEDLTQFNYGSIIYSKTPIVFDYLMEYMGESNLDKAMQFYYERYKFKHPKPNDLATTLSYFSGIDLKWFLNNLILSDKKIDYKLSKVKRQKDGSYKLIVKNKQNTIIPFNVTAFKNNKMIGQVWNNGFEGKDTVAFPIADVDYFKIDGRDLMPDINRNNNYIKTNGIFKKSKPIKLKFLAQYDDAKHCQISYIPLLGGNYYNGIMPGVVLHNYSFFEKKFEYKLAPMFGLKSKTLVGSGQVNYHIYPKNLFQSIELQSNLKSYNYDEVDFSNTNKLYGTDFKTFDLTYYKLTPSAQLTFKKKKQTNPTNHSINIGSNILFIDSVRIENDLNSSYYKANLYTINNSVNRIIYLIENNRIINPFNLELTVQQNAQMAKTFAVFKYKLNVAKNKDFGVRVFAGTFLYGKDWARDYYRFRMRAHYGSDDYLFESNFLARNLNSNFGNTQINEADGYFKVPTPLGQSNSWMAAVNLTSPNFYGFEVFLDIGTTNPGYLFNDKILYNAGISLHLFKGFISFHYPLIYSKDIKTVMELNSIKTIEKLRWSFNLHKLNPKKFIKNSLF